MMTLSKYFNFVRSELVKSFLETFGGNFSYSSEFTYTYEYGKKIYFLGDKDFEKDVEKSIEQGENLLLNYKEVHW